MENVKPILVWGNKTKEKQNYKDKLITLLRHMYVNIYSLDPENGWNPVTESLMERQNKAINYHCYIAIYIIHSLYMCIFGNMSQLL